MATIAENLLALQQTKENFKTSFESKGVDLTDVPFTEYPNKLEELKEDLDTELTEQETALNELEGAVNGLQQAPKTDGEYFVKVIDYDGTILKEAWLDAGDTFTLPNPPSHDGLVFQEWSCSQDIVDNVITIEDNNVMAGATYTTASGLNEFDIELTKVTGLAVTLNMDGTKDWGDGTSDDLTTHTYTNYGKYTIKCNGTTMTASASSGLFSQAISNKNYYCVNIRFAGITRIVAHVLRWCCALTSVTIPNSVKTIDYYTFTNCDNLTSIVIPRGVTSTDSYIFNSCFLLTSVVIPNSITKIGGSYAFTSCYFLKNISIPSSVTSLGSSVFSSCYSLESIILPNSVTQTDTAVFNNCITLKKITIPNSLTTIKSFMFSTCRALTTYDFSTHTIVPTLSHINVFENINRAAKIIVPDNLYDEWVSATNWNQYQSYIYKVSEVA